MKKVLVTGATRGIGKEICNKFRENGYYVIGTGTKFSFDQNYLDDYIKSDFENNEDIECLCKYIFDGKIDVLVNNAGINIINDFCNINSDDFLKVQQVNIYAPFKLSQSVIPYMKDNKWGRIVNISSIWASMSKRGRSNYSISKAALNSMTASISIEFADQGILCNSVSPGFIDTDMTWTNLKKDGVQEVLKNVPIKRLAKVEEVANLVYMLGSEQNTYISGQNMIIDGGFICGKL